MQRIMQMDGEVLYAVQTIGNLAFIKAQNQRTQTSQQLLYTFKGNEKVDNDNINQALYDMIMFCKTDE